MLDLPRESAMGFVTNHPNPGYKRIDIPKEMGGREFVGVSALLIFLLPFHEGALPRVTAQ